MTQDDVLRYLRLVDRKFALMDCQYGDRWKPEYAAELENIDKELSELRILVDEELEKRKKHRPNSHT